jgi:hypothetical protein
MENSKSNKNGTIKLPNQVLSLDLIKKAGKLKKIILQFDVESGKDGDKAFSLVAYPVYKTKKGLKFGKRIPLTTPKDNDSKELPLPLTLGNLELSVKKLGALKKSGNKNLSFTAYLYEKNAHAAYTVSDDRGQAFGDANPCPPAKPADV